MRAQFVKSWLGTSLARAPAPVFQFMLCRSSSSSSLSLPPFSSSLPHALITDRPFNRCFSCFCQVTRTEVATNPQLGLVGAATARVAVRPVPLNPATTTSATGETAVNPDALMVGARSSAAMAELVKFGPHVHSGLGYKKKCEQKML